MRFVLLVLFATSLYGSSSICRRMSAGSGKQSDCTAALAVIDLTQDCSTVDVGDDRVVPPNRLVNKVNAQY